MPKKKGLDRKRKSTQNSKPAAKPGAKKQPPPSSKRRKSDQTQPARDKVALKKRLQGDIGLLKNSKGSPRTFEENKMILLVLWGGADDVAGYNYFRKSRSLTRITVIRLYQTNACLGSNAMT
tara:strand:+ start:47 stop:412 length:366 start_codon:yes stop_codon:yes gene_type:complete